MNDINCDRRQLLRAGGVGATLLASGCHGYRPARPPRSRLRRLGEATLPYRLQFRGTTVGGLSGIDYDATTGTWLVISDDRSAREPVRVYRLELPITPQGVGPVSMRDLIVPKRRDGAPYQGQRRGHTADAESIRLLPDGRSFLWTSEGGNPLVEPPFLAQARIDGTHLRRFALPVELRTQRGVRAGPRANASLEGLAIVPGATRVWVAMEAPLRQDGPVPSVGSSGAPCRFIEYDMATGQPRRQIAYLADPIGASPIPPGAFADNGVSEILMIDADRMLVLERAYVTGRGTSLRIYEIDTRSTPHFGNGVAAKKLVADFATLGLSLLDNTEGMAWGPALPNGRRSLVCVSDDNFNPMQATQFVAFEYQD